MSAPLKNQFWKLRSKHGRDHIFSSPEHLLEEAYKYFEIQSKKTWNKIDYRGKDLKRIEIPVNSPFSIRSLSVFLGVNSDYLNSIEKKGEEGFSEVIKHIRDVIETQQLEGAITGTFNARIVSRLLGLADKQEHRHEITEIDFTS